MLGAVPDSRTACPQALFWMRAIASMVDWRSCSNVRVVFFGRPKSWMAGKNLIFFYFFSGGSSRKNTLWKFDNVDPFLELRTGVRRTPENELSSSVNRLFEVGNSCGRCPTRKKIKKVKCCHPAFRWLRSKKNNAAKHACGLRGVSGIVPNVEALLK